MQKVNMADEIIDMLKLCGVTPEQVVNKGADDLVAWMDSAHKMLCGFVLGKHRDINCVPDDETFEDIAKDVIAKLSGVV